MMDPLPAWECPDCHTRRIVECAHENVGVPACPKCQSPMERQDYDGWLASGLERLRMTYPGGLGEP